MTTYNILYSPTTDLEVLKTALGVLGASVNFELPELRVLNVTAADTMFSGISGIDAFEEDKTVTVNASYSWHQLRVSSLGLPMKTLYAPRNHGESGIVYLVDSGVDTSHAEFTYSNITNLHSFIADDFTDTQGHGTSMASLIVGNTLGISKNALLKVVKIPMMENTSLSVLLTAFNAILADHQLSSGVKAVNCSWTIPKSLILDTKIAELQNAGLIVVAAAGNTGEAADNFSPVGLDTVVGVAASDAYDRVISWAPGASSNWGPEVDITAPGIEVDVASISSETGYAVASGTSLSAAIVSGIVCQHITDDNTLSAEQIKTRMLLPPYASEDVLFRNESIYGTTPNRLIHCVLIAGLVENISSAVIIKSGETSTFTLQLTQYVESVNVHNVIVGPRTHDLPDWVSFDQTTNTFTFSPPSDLQIQSVLIMLELFKDNERLGVPGFVVKIYHENISELDIEEKYHLILKDENEIVFVQPAYCGGGCGYWTPCNQSPGSKNPCVCTTNWGGSCVTGFIT